MRVAVVSDIHDNIWNLDKALKLVADAAVLLCCGDICSPFTLKMLAEGFPGPVHVVFGNNDGDVKAMLQRHGISFNTDAAPAAAAAAAAPTVRK